MKNHDDDTCLWDKISQGDDRAFKQLFDKYYQKLFHTAYYFLKSRETAEEAVSDVFYTLWKKKTSASPIHDMENYLYISVKHQALQYLRHTAISDTEPLELYQIERIPDSDTPEERFLNQEYRTLVQEAVDALPGKCREVFRLVLSDRLKHKDIARLLDISEKTVEAHISTAYKKIACYVKKEYRKVTLKREKTSKK